MLKETFNQTLLQSKIEIQEQTLDHISKELHANFSHLISVININLSTLSPDKPNDMNEKINESKSLVKQLMSELKALSVGLNTDHILHSGFQKMLENELNRLSNTKEYNVTVTKKGSEYRLPTSKEIILFRMCQEILNNIIKHAEAKTITVLLNYTPELFQLEISDDGKGFNLEQVLVNKADSGSTGITNIFNRSKLINADVKIDCEKGKGTNTIVKILI